MPTIEERLIALEQAQAAIRAERIADLKQLDEQIQTLRRQLAAQQERQQTLEKALTQQFKNIDGRFTQLSQHMDQRFEQQAESIRDIAKNATITYGLAVTQQEKMATMQGDIRDLKQGMLEVMGKTES